MKRLVKIIASKLDSYWYAGKIGETFWVDDDSESQYRVCDTEGKWSWIDINDCAEVIEEQAGLIGISEARVLHKAGGVLRSRPASFAKFSLPEDLIKAYKAYLDSKDSFNYVLRKYEFEEL